ncbi:hypothetical protein HNR77_003915 [Paenibacillus sp. JGP012]|uniref:hypothetical protein n=1 Tax=Paenibacillus sp. JGP012 TaxID=2735914 RepID=UPI001614BF8F|nr:hypothetical protein [Paenibacillus sp. JGP012]MBB6022816.1 hypothetical protein [Paenibacillus sp. JGP012]
MKKSFYVLLGILLLGSALFLWFYSFPTPIERVNEVVIQDNPNTFSDSATVTMKGKLYRPLFRQSYFEGTIKISSLEFTNAYKLFPLYMVKEGEIYSSFVTYSGSSQQLNNVTGVMFHDADFTTFNLFLREVPYKDKTRDLIQVVSPASDEADAEQVLDKLKLKFPEMPSAEKLLPQK